MTSVLAAMSGGVDSSVATALMVEAGHDVIGVTLKLWQGPDGSAPTAGCCTVSDAEDARRVAAQLDIPYYVLDYTEDFMHGVVGRFVADYASGRTPNPCIECNRRVKFSRLLDQATDLGCDLVVTGHYARTEHVGERWRLLRGRDIPKDQSYVVSMLGQQQLARVRFPVGDLTKAQTRAKAAALGLRTANKPESQDICFVGQGDYRSFLRGVAPDIERPGPIVDVDGAYVGDHSGVIDVTVGQRRGLGLSLGEPVYVVETRPESATVVVGTRRHLAVSAIELDQVSWVAEPLDPGSSVEVQYRAHGEAVSGTWTGGRVDFDRPQTAVASGQTASLYRGDEVLGGGIIEGTIRS